jgi:hypothetical protein
VLRYATKHKTQNPTEVIKKLAPFIRFDYISVEYLVMKVEPKWGDLPEVHERLYPVFRILFQIFILLRYTAFKAYSNRDNIKRQPPRQYGTHYSYWLTLQRSPLFYMEQEQAWTKYYIKGQFCKHNNSVEPSSNRPRDASRIFLRGANR